MSIDGINCITFNTILALTHIRVALSASMFTESLPVMACTLTEIKMHAQTFGPCKRFKLQEGTRRDLHVTMIGENIGK